MNGSMFRWLSVGRLRLRGPRTRGGLGVFALIALVIATTFVLPAMAAPDPADVPDPTPTHGMTQALDIDLRTDPRKDFQVAGPVEFTAGRLTLGPARQRSSRAGRRQPGQADAEPGVHAADRGRPDVHDAPSHSRSATAAILSWRSSGDATEARPSAGCSSLTEMHPGDERGLAEKETRTLTTSPWNGDFPDGSWTFRHHHGLVTVYFGEKRIVAGYAAKEPRRDWQGRAAPPPADEGFFRQCGISEPMEISGWSLEQEGMPVACLAVSGIASPSYRQKLSPSSRARLAARLIQQWRLAVPEEENLRARIDRRVSPDDAYQDSLQQQFAAWERGEPKLLRTDLTGRSLTGVAENLGKRHHYYALALAGVGMQFFWVGNKDEVAERLLKQAAEIAEESLGTWHPDYALVVTALARVYIKTGKLQLAEPLLKKLSEATATAFGTESFRYAATLRELAVLQQYNGRLAEAETTLRQSVDACKDAPLPQRANALIALGELEAVMGERKKADAVLKRAAEAFAEEIKRLRSSGGVYYMPLFVPLRATMCSALVTLPRRAERDRAAVDPIGLLDPGPVLGSGRNGQVPGVEPGHGQCRTERIGDLGSARGLWARDARHRRAVHRDSGTSSPPREPCGSSIRFRARPITSAE